MPTFLALRMEWLLIIHVDWIASSLYSKPLVEILIYYWLSIRLVLLSVENFTVDWSEAARVDERREQK